MEKISVVVPLSKIPSYNLSGLRSIFNSTYRNLEVILLKNGVDEDLLEELDEFQSSTIMYEKSFVNRAAANNFGLRKSTGELISFFDIRDINGKMRFEMSTKRLENNPKAGMVFCSTTYINENGEFLKGVSKYPDYNNDLFIGNMYEQNKIKSISASIMRTDLIRKLGGFKEALGDGSEYDLYLRLARRSKIDYIDLPLLRHRIENNTVHDLNAKYSYTDHELAVLQKCNIKDLASGLSSLYKKESEFRLSLGNILMKIGKPQEAILHLMKSASLDPGNGNASYTAGNCFLLTGDFNSAAIEFNNCLKVNPEHVSCLHNLGLVYNYLGENNKSKAKLVKAQKLNKKLKKPVLNSSSFLEEITIQSGLQTA